jgi:hypothetical protein
MQDFLLQRSGIMREGDEVVEFLLFTFRNAAIIHILHGGPASLLSQM